MLRCFNVNVDNGVELCKSGHAFLAIGANGTFQIPSVSSSLQWLDCDKQIEVLGAYAFYVKYGGILKQKLKVRTQRVAVALQSISTTIQLEEYLVRWLTHKTIIQKQLASCSKETGGKTTITKTSSTSHRTQLPILTQWTLTTTTSSGQHCSYSFLFLTASRQTRVPQTIRPVAARNNSTLMMPHYGTRTFHKQHWVQTNKPSHHKCSTPPNYWNNSHPSNLISCKQQFDLIYQHSRNTLSNFYMHNCTHICTVTIITNN